MQTNAAISILRNNIDNVDRQIVNLIGERLGYAKILSNIKKNNNLNVEDINRENEVISKVIVQSKLNPHISEDFITNIFKQIISYTKTIENE